MQHRGGRHLGANMLTLPTTVNLSPVETGTACLDGTAGALACWVVGLAPAQDAVGTAHAGQAEAR